MPGKAVGARLRVLVVPGRTGNNERADRHFFDGNVTSVGGTAMAEPPTLFFGENVNRAMADSFVVKGRLWHAQVVCVGKRRRVLQSGKRNVYGVR